MFGFKRRRRDRLRAQPVPDAWHDIIARNVPHLTLLTPDEEKLLLSDVHVLLAEKRFEGCGGLPMTDEIRVTIAAQAALLLLNRPTDYFAKLSSILVYPARYVAFATRRLPDGTVVEGDEVRLGESWHHGNVVLSWNDAAHGAVHPHDGLNVVLHEFAHQLDSESGDVNGAPRLPPDMLDEWSRVLSTEFEQLQDAVQARRRTVIHPYGATSPAEFFAVTTETFFERPTPLAQHHPELYQQFRHYFRQDPAARLLQRTGET
jgi:Mlc titration factor MtfA (ptsG expression regulator)